MDAQAYVHRAEISTIFIATPEDEAEVRRRIRAALEEGHGWQVVSEGARAVAADEEEIAARLARAPRRP